MLFGPILLDLQGFYRIAVPRITKWKSLVQIASGDDLPQGIIVSAWCPFFVRLPLVSRSMPLMFYAPWRSVGSIGQGTVDCPTHLAGRANFGGDYREPFYLAGLPQDLAALEETFTPRAETPMYIVGRNRHRDTTVIRPDPGDASPIPLPRSYLPRLTAVESGGVRPIGACEVERRARPGWLQIFSSQHPLPQADVDAFRAAAPCLVFRSTPDVSLTSCSSRI